MAHADIIIIGKGYLGSRFAEFFGERAALVDVDITSLSALEAVIIEYTPDCLINAAGKTLTSDIEKSENKSTAFMVNVQGPANLAYLAHLYNFHLIQLSTCMVYGGPVPEQGWRETDQISPVNYYAWTKAWADAELAPFAERDHITILRIRTPLSAVSHPRNLLNKLQTFSSVVDEPSSLTVVEDLLVVIDQILSLKKYGTFNVVNPGAISLYSIVIQLREAGLIPVDKHIQALTVEDLEKVNQAWGKASQPFPILNTDKLASIGIHMRDVQTAVTESIQQFKAAIQ
jgi:dTDP-4-dehydrorhamnose reductase